LALLHRFLERGPNVLHGEPYEESEPERLA